MLTLENYSKGFLIDEELMGGVTEDPSAPGTYVAFVLRHTTGEYLGYQPFRKLDLALAAINGVQRDWAYESTSGCGGGCGEGGACGTNKCGKSYACKGPTCPAAQPQSQP